MNNLAPEQKIAISHTKGAACVIAGAGTGKTTTLVEHIIYLVEDFAAEPNHIYVTTFTHKATAELYSRTFECLGEKAQKLHISTIDALIYDLSREAMQQGLMQSRRLIGEANQRVLLLDCAWEVIGKKQTNWKSYWTDNAGKAGLVGLLEKSVRKEIADKHEKSIIQKSIKRKLNEHDNRFGFDFQIPSIRDLNLTAKMYYEKLNELTAIDYDLLTKDFLICLKRNKKFLQDFTSQSNHLIVDEFQDTSRVQMEILLILAGKKRQIWVVGDPCQQIYEWRGAGSDNLYKFIKTTKAKKYYLTENHRSTQVILDSAYNFLSKRVPNLKKIGMLRQLYSRRDLQSNTYNNYPVYTSTLDNAFNFIAGFLKSNPNIKPSDVAILSRKLTKPILKEINQKAEANKLKVQFHSSRADRTMEETIGYPPPWIPGSALKNLYKHKSIQSLVAQSLSSNDYSDLRSIRPLATAAEALDSTLAPDTLSFRDAWPALKITQDREVHLSSAVTNKSDFIQIMTIHAAKGLEFPVVILMKLGKGSPKSFPDPKDAEECRLAYVGATRARDLLILVHITTKPHETLSAFGNRLVPIHKNKVQNSTKKIEVPSIHATPPIVAATHLDLYEQCPLKFAAYHEGRLLPEWSEQQSCGSRIHKALEYYLHAGFPKRKYLVNNCFEQGFKDGDSPLRTLPNHWVREINESFKRITKILRETSKKAIAVEQRYRYIHANSGQIEGVIDAVIQQKDGNNILKEWKATSKIVKDKKQSYTLQASAGALGMMVINSHQIHLIEIVPLLDHGNGIKYNFDSNFIEQTNQKLDKIFRDLRDRKYKAKKGSHCRFCQIKKQCPAKQR
ncbi:MAG: ATP-dependent DNA helicase [Ignavibacteriaceae bacterium]